MLAAPSSHKRKRSSARADKKRGAAEAGGRLIANAVTPEHARAAALAHPFNYAIDLVLPGSAPHVHTAIRAAAQRASPSIARVSAALFLEPSFVANYIRTGSLYALSTAALDSDDALCLDGNGMLILSLTKDTYQTLGLVGRPSRFSYGASGRCGDRKSGAMARYIVELPLLAPSFVPGKRGYERALHCLRAWDARREQHTSAPSWTVLLAWTPPENMSGQTRPSNVQVPPPCTQRAVPIDVHAQHVPDAWVPDWHTGATDDASLLAMLEWGGLAALASPRIRTFSEQITPVASYALPAPCSAGEYTHISLRGFIAPQVACEALAAARMWSDKHERWSFVSTTGFADAPIAWQSAHPGVSLPLGSGKSIVPGDDTARTCSRRKVHNKGYIRPGETEHGILRTGENGWCSFTVPHAHMIYVESMELDTHN